MIRSQVILRDVNGFSQIPTPSQHTYTPTKSHPPLPSGPPGTRLIQFSPVLWSANDIITPFSHWHPLVRTYPHLSQIIHHIISPWKKKLRASLDSLVWVKLNSSTHLWQCFSHIIWHGFFNRCRLLEASFKLGPERVYDSLKHCPPQTTQIKRTTSLEDFQSGIADAFLSKVWASRKSSKHHLPHPHVFHLTMFYLTWLILLEYPILIYVRWYQQVSTSLLKFRL